MDIHWAVNRLKEYGKVRRAEWENKKFYLQFDNGDLHCHSGRHKAIAYIISVDDMYATDWEEFKGEEE